MLCSDSCSYPSSVTIGLVEPTWEFHENLICTWVKARGHRGSESESGSRDGWRWGDRWDRGKEDPPVRMCRRWLKGGRKERKAKGRKWKDKRGGSLHFFWYIFSLNVIHCLSHPPHPLFFAGPFLFSSSCCSFIPLSQPSFFYSLDHPLPLKTPCSASCCFFPAGHFHSSGIQLNILATLWAPSDKHRHCPPPSPIFSIFLPMNHFHSHFI